MDLVLIYYCLLVGRMRARGEPAMKQHVHVLQNACHAQLILPCSKSMTNRALIMAAQCAMPSHVQNILRSDDTQTCLRALESINTRSPINCQDAGTVARFLVPMCAAMGGEYHFDGSPRLRERPLQDLLHILEQQGAIFEWLGKPYSLPFILRSTGLRGGNIHVSVHDSSQFLSGLIMAAPLVKTGMTITSTEALKTLPYVQMTLQLMRAFGIKPEVLNDFTIRILPTKYQAATVNIEPDASTASYFFAAAALCKGSVRIMGLSTRSVQGDLAFLTCLERMGCRVIKHHDSIEVSGVDTLKSLGEVNMKGFSDTFMTLAIIAPFLSTPTTILGLKHTRLQESDRIAAMVDGLTRLGIKTQDTIDSLTIFPGTPIGCTIDSYNDHRIAMSFATMGLKVPSMSIDNAACVSKTCPSFFQLLKTLGE